MASRHSELVYYKKRNTEEKKLIVVGVPEQQ